MDVIITSIPANIPKIISDTQNDALMWPVTIHELDQAMTDTTDGKLLGLDCSQQMFWRLSKACGSKGAFLKLSTQTFMP